MLDVTRCMLPVAAFPRSRRPKTVATWWSFFLISFMLFLGMFVLMPQTVLSIPLHSLLLYMGVIVVLFMKRRESLFQKFMSQASNVNLSDSNTLSNPSAPLWSHGQVKVPISLVNPLLLL